VDSASKIAYGFTFSIILILVLATQLPIRLIGIDLFPVKEHHILYGVSILLEFVS
jgi:hypothetical protein